MRSGRIPRPRHPASALRYGAAILLSILLPALAACGTAAGVVPPLVSDPLLPSVASAEPGGSARPGPAPGGAAPRRDPAREESLEARLGRLFSEARTLVERDSDTDLSEIRLSLVDDRALLDEVGVETRRLVHGRLGTGPLAERLLETLVDGQGGTYAALYSGRRRTVLVSRDVLAGYLASLPPTRAERDGALLVLMLHELVHAADDLRHDIHANRTLDFRASFAQSAAFEGHAQWRTRDICRRHGCLGGLASLDAFMFGDGTRGVPDGEESAEAAQGTLPLDRNLLEYSYVEGERFVAALAARPDGAALVERLLAEPPRDPLQILDPASFPNEAREARNRVLLNASARTEHPWLARDEAGGALDPRARVAIETSPLKGVNLRADPARRRAAVDGFTRLVIAMVAVQFHDPVARSLSPIEVTLMQTDGARTARLFAETLHAHALVPGASASADDDARGALVRTATPLPDGGTWHTAIASSGPFVVQASGRDATPALMDDYVLGVLAELAGGPA